VLTGFQPGGFTVPAGQNWKIQGLVETDANAVVEGTLTLRAGDTLRFINVDELAFVGGGDVPVASDVGLWITGSGVLDALGTPKVAWNRTGTDATWLPTDELRVTPTVVGDFGTGGFALFTAGGVVPRAHAEVPPAEVLNLTRDCAIEGTPGGRSHVWIKSSSPQTIKYVTLRYLGPRMPGDPEHPTVGRPGRYALHFHKMGDASRTSLIEGVVARDIGNHCFVAHNSHGVTFRDCISYDTWDEPYWWDPTTVNLPNPPDNFSNDIIYDRCIAGLVHADPDFRAGRLAGFWIGTSTVDNSCKALGCVAVGVLGDSHVSGFHWPESNEGVWVFQDCVAHNNQHLGIFTWQNTPKVHVVERFTAYRNGRAGIQHGAYVNPYIYRDALLVEHQSEGVLNQARSPNQLEGPKPPLRYERTRIVGSPVGFREGEVQATSNPPANVCASSFGSVATEFDDSFEPTVSFDVRAGC